MGSYTTALPLSTRPSLRSSIVSPGRPTTRFTRRVPSRGEKKTTMSPRRGLLHSAMWRGADREDDQPQDEPPTDFLAPPVARAGAESRGVHEAFDPAPCELFKGNCR